MSEFFTFYPQVEYCDELSTNLMVRSRIRRMVIENSVLFHPYILTEEDRPDIVSHKYYGNANYAWLLFYANELFEPLYDWPLTSQDFEKFVFAKYPNKTFVQNNPHIYFDAAAGVIGSANAATSALLNSIKKGPLQLRVTGTDNNGENDGNYTILNKDYNPNTGLITFRVFEPVEDMGANQNGMLVTLDLADPRISIHHYENAAGDEIDIFAYSSLAEEVVINLSVPTGTFEVGETVIGQTSGASAVVVAQNESGSIIEANGLVGSFQNGETIQGVSSSTIVSITSSVQGRGRSAVTVYEYEDRVNEANREINIIDSTHLDAILNELRDIFEDD